MQEQKEEKKEIPIPQIMLILLQQLNYTAYGIRSSGKGSRRQPAV